jgi:hypothetical protein
MHTDSTNQKQSKTRNRKNLGRREFPNSSHISFKYPVFSSKESQTTQRIMSHSKQKQINQPANRDQMADLLDKTLECLKDP